MLAVRGDVRTLCTEVQGPCGAGGGAQGQVSPEQAARRLKGLSWPMTFKLEAQKCQTLSQETAEDLMPLCFPPRAACLMVSLRVACMPMGSGAFQGPE